MCPARRPWRAIGLLVILVLVAAAMGAAASAQVATLGSPAPDASTAPSSPAPDAQQALLDWTACMREQGIDMDDPVFGLDGELSGGLGKDGKGAKVDAKGEAYTAADEACADLLVAYKPPPDAQLLAEQAELRLDWAACMRRQGIDMPDPGPDGSFSSYDWKIDLKAEAYTAADETCRETTGGSAK